MKLCEHTISWLMETTGFLKWSSIERQRCSRQQQNRLQCTPAGNWAPSTYVHWPLTGSDCHKGVRQHCWKDPSEKRNISLRLSLVSLLLWLKEKVTVEILVTAGEGSTAKSLLCLSKGSVDFQCHGWTFSWVWQCGKVCKISERDFSLSETWLHTTDRSKR